MVRATAVKGSLSLMGAPGKPSWHCRFCSHQLKPPFLDLGRMPPSNSYLLPQDLYKEERKYPLQVFFCEDCFLVQVPNIVDAQDIFTEYAYFSSASRSWLDAAGQYAANACHRFQLNEKSLVIEIASNDEYLLQFFKSRSIPVLGVDPAKNVAKAAVDRGIPTVIKFFGVQTAREFAAQGRLADLIVANNVLAHVPDLNDFVKGLRIVLKPRGVITLEFPHLLNLLKGMQFDTIYHEHFSYFSAMTVQKVLADADLELYDIEELPTHGGSLRIYVAHRGIHRPSERMMRLLRREKKAGMDRPEIYRKFARGVKHVKQKLLVFLRQARKEKKLVIGYGAPAKGNTLLNYCGITRDLLPATVDVSSYKQGRFLPGSRIPIYATEFIGAVKPDFVLILPWNLRDEIMDRMKLIRSWGGQFVIPIPEVKVYR